MAGDPFKKIGPGEKFRLPAEAYNAFIDAARAVRSQFVAGATPGVVANDHGMIKVRNSSGGARERFEILGLNGPLADPEDYLSIFKQQPLFDGVVPTDGLDDTPDHRGNYCVLLQPLPEDAIGDALISGFVPVKIDRQWVGFGRADVRHNSCASLTFYPAGSATVKGGQTIIDGETWYYVQIGKFEGGFYGIVSEEDINSGPDIDGASFAAEVAGGSVDTPRLCLRVEKAIALPEVGSGFWAAWSGEKWYATNIGSLSECNPIFGDAELVEAGDTDSFLVVREGCIKRVAADPCTTPIPE